MSRWDEWCDWTCASSDERQDVPDAANRAMDCDWQQTCVSSLQVVFRHYRCALDPSAAHAVNLSPLSPRDGRHHLGGNTVKTIRRFWPSLLAVCALLVVALPAAAQVTETGTIEVFVLDQPGCRFQARTSSPPQPTPSPSAKPRPTHRTGAARRPRALGELYRHDRAVRVQADAQRERARAYGADRDHPRAARRGRSDRTGAGHGRSPIVDARSATTGRTSRCS